MADDKGPMILTVCWTFTAFALLFVGFRLFVRAAVHRKLFLDDYWIIFSSICAILSNILVTISVHWGNGKHFTVLDTEQKQETIRWMMAAYVPGIETLGFPKLAVITLLTRLLMPSKLHLIILWTMGIICCMSLTAMVMALLLQCSPPRALWTLSMERHCLDVKILEGLAFWASTCSAFLDFYLAVYPAIVLWKLKMPVQKRLALCLALGMGVISGCVGIKKATGVPTLASSDVSYDLCDPLYWTSIEGNLIIIAACIPILQPLLEMIRGHPIWNSKKNSSNQYEDYSRQSGPGIELRSKPRKKVDNYGFTIHAKDDSEESINPPDKQSATSATSSSRRSDIYQHNHHDHGILKTNAVTVEYDHGDDGPTSATSRWAAV